MDIISLKCDVKWRFVFKEMSLEDMSTLNSAVKLNGLCNFGEGLYEKYLCELF